MAELPDQMQTVWAALASVSGGASASVMFVAARSGDGTSVCARAFAQLAAIRAPRSAMLFDLDLFSDGQFKALGGEAGGWQGPFDMSFGAAPFWRAAPRARTGEQGEGAVAGYRVGATKLFVSRFRPEALLPGQTMQVLPAPDYWQAARGAIDISVVDAPALERSRAGLALVSDMDAVVLVIDRERADPRDSVELRDEIVARGGRCLGIVATSARRKGFSLRRTAAS